MLGCSLQQILFKLNYVMRIATAYDACKFHEDRWKEHVAVIYEDVMAFSVSHAFARFNRVKLGFIVYTKDRIIT